MTQQEPAHTHLLVLSQALLRLGELVALSLLGHGIIIVGGSHGGQQQLAASRAGQVTDKEKRKESRQRRLG